MYSALSGLHFLSKSPPRLPISSILHGLTLSTYFSKNHLALTYHSKNYGISVFCCEDTKCFKKNVRGDVF